jgi:hypothetical protein
MATESHMPLNTVTMTGETQLRVFLSGYCSRSSSSSVLSPRTTRTIHPRSRWWIMAALCATSATWHTALPSRGNGGMPLRSCCMILLLLNSIAFVELNSRLSTATEICALSLSIIVSVNMLWPRNGSTNHSLTATPIQPMRPENAFFC